MNEKPRPNHGLIPQPEQPKPPKPPGKSGEESINPAPKHGETELPKVEQLVRINRQGGKRQNADPRKSLGKGGKINKKGGGPTNKNQQPHVNKYANKKDGDKQGGGRGRKG